MLRRKEYDKCKNYQHIIEQLIKFQKTIGTLQDLKVLLGRTNYKILYNALALAHGVRIQ